MLKTFSIQTLGCKVNQYESEQVATFLHSRGLTQVPTDQAADLRVVNTCSVTTEAATKSRRIVRRTTRLPVLQSHHSPLAGLAMTTQSTKTIVMGCWATSDRTEAARLPGVDAVLTHTDDVARSLDELLREWSEPANFDRGDNPASQSSSRHSTFARESDRNDGWMIQSAGTPGALPVAHIDDDHNNKPHASAHVKQKSENRVSGTRSLPLLNDRDSGHQRAFLKVQDGCDAHCTYCIIPQLRPTLWSKSIDDCVREARDLVAAGHHEIVLTGIFLGAYGQSTALRRRQTAPAAPIGRLIEALCDRVPALRRLRLSSLEPGDLTDELLDVLRSHGQVVPHFHLPLQSGSDRILRRMNRQYVREDFLRMLDRVQRAYDRPAITTDIIAGFPGETDDDFAATLDLVDRARFIHVHAFPFSPRPRTAAARWGDDFVEPPVARQRIEKLQAHARAHSFDFRKSFVGETVELIVERSHTRDTIQHGRCPRYFDVQFSHAEPLCGRIVRVRIDRVTTTRTHGSLIDIEPETFR